MHSPAFTAVWALALLQLAGARLQKERKPTGFMNIAPVKTGDLRDELETAVEEALGHGHGIESGKLQLTRQMLLPTYRALPKNSVGNIELPALRHLVYRHFMQKDGISIKAFEPHQPLNGSELSAAEVLQDRAPAYVEELLRGRFAHHGFTLKDSVAIVVTLEQLLFDDSRRRLEDAFEQYEELSMAGDVEFNDAVQVLQYFFMTVLGYENPIEEDFTYETRNLANGELSRISFERQSRGMRFSRGEHFSFGELTRAAHAMVQSASQLYATCDTMREELARRGKASTGRVRLADFYGGDQSSEKFWFGESKDWLRRLGALDESSSWMGPQVLIPNYIGAVPNCILSTGVYRVCCHNGACEQIMDTLEKQLGRSAAKPSEIEPLLKSLTTDLQDVQTPFALGEKLEQIAEHHGGTVPLHGRLFAQVLHYAAPLECPFPHKRGTIMAQTFEECGEGCLVSDEDREQAETERDLEDALANTTQRDGTSPQDAWLSQWTHEEELISDIGGGKLSELGTGLWPNYFGVAALLSLMLWVLRPSNTKVSKGQLPFGGMGSKSHLV